MYGYLALPWDSMACLSNCLLIFIIIQTDAVGVLLAYVVFQGLSPGIYLDFLCVIKKQ